MSLFARIEKIELSNFKNVEYGEMILTNSLKNPNNGNLVGIYGQNGSGKTALLNAVSLIKRLMSGESLPKDVDHLIKIGKKSFEIKLEFYLKYSEVEYQVFYEINIGALSNKENLEFGILEEKLSYRFKRKDDSKWEALKTLLNVKGENITPNYRLDELKQIFKEDFDLPYLIRDCSRDNRSFIFSKELKDMTQNYIHKLNYEYNLLAMLSQYAQVNLFVVENRQMGLSYANVYLPLNLRVYEDKPTSFGVVSISLESSNELSADRYEFLANVFLSINKIITELIPGLTIELKQINKRLNENNDIIITFELMSNRNGEVIPLRYESAGIKKLLSIINLLTATYNDESMSLFIDELDSGIYEYLLGEILINFEKFADGQLVFTSHNLRPLEVLDKDNLYFTTTNPNNRYIKVKDIKSNNNLRDTYFRNILLGGQNEELYKPTKSSNIRRAFRMAGDIGDAT